MSSHSTQKHTMYYFVKLILQSLIGSLFGEMTRTQCAAWSSTVAVLKVMTNRHLVIQCSYNSSPVQLSNLH